MKLTSDNETLAENKVLILYILNKIDRPVSNDELLQLVLSIEDMNYFYFQQFLLDLLENKYIETYKENDFSEQIYRLTLAGKDALELTKDLIPGIVKLKIDSTIKGELQDIEEEISIISEFTPEDDGGFIVTCKIVEHNKTIFKVSISAASREQDIGARQITNAIRNAYIEFIKIGLFIQKISFIPLQAFQQSLCQRNDVLRL
jgi:hypothetical protein